jgi:CHAD domain-containing protein
MGVVPDDSAAGVVLGYLRDQTRALREQEPRVRHDEDDAVHQMRVAARRLRSALQIFGKVLERARTRALTDELRWLAGELAPARDTEVMHARVRELLAEVPDELVVGSPRSDVEAFFAREGVAAREQALAALDGPRYRALLEALDALVVDPPLGGRALRDAHGALRHDVARAHRRVVAAMADAGTAHQDEARDDEAIHDARKAAKRLRYAHEAARPALAPQRRWTRRMAGVQDLLGVYQDTVVTRETLRRIAAGSAGQAFTLGVMYGAEASRGRLAADALPAAWARVPALA